MTFGKLRMERLEGQVKATETRLLEVEGIVKVALAEMLDIIQRHNQALLEIEKMLHVIGGITGPEATHPLTASGPASHTPPD